MEICGELMAGWMGRNAGSGESVPSGASVMVSGAMLTPCPGPRGTSGRGDAGSDDLRT